MRLRSRSITLLTLVVLVSGVSFYAFKRRTPATKYLTAQIERGDVVETVGATGALQAVTTVQVGSQVSGTVRSLNADFNSVVKRGQVIARLDPSLFEARLGQAQANLMAARANVERQKASVADLQQKFTRARELSEQSLLPQSDLETAKANYDGALAQLKANEAAVNQAQANVNQAEVDLDHTIIATPIDGVVLSRNVDVGQTVAASLQAPVLFVIANDLTRMQVNASIDEADVGRVASGQDVSFRVDAFPDRSFVGRVDQVRLQPQTLQNVVSYNTIITVDNAEQKLLPGMTATVQIAVQRAAGVLRLPAGSLRFRPEGFTDRERGPRPSAEGPREGAAAAAGERGPRREGGAGARSEGRDAAGPARGRRGLVFSLNAAGKPQPVPVRVGLADGQFVELIEGLDEGATIVTGIDTGTQQARAGAPRVGASPTSNPFAPGPPARRQR